MITGQEKSYCCTIRNISNMLGIQQLMWMMYLAEYIYRFVHIHIVLMNMYVNKSSQYIPRALLPQGSHAISTVINAPF
jgi:hypothetical protein